MNHLRLAILHLGIICSLVSLGTSYADDTLNQRADEIAKKAMQITSEEEGVVTIALQGGHALANKTQILFFRRRGSRMEVIANGVVTGEKKNKVGANEMTVEVDRDSIIKYPIKGDFAIPMADPNASGGGNKGEQFDYLRPGDDQKPKENDRPGYIEVGLGILKGNLSTNSTTHADAFKNVSGYRFKIFHFAYYLEMFPVGIELDSHSGIFPTSTYYAKKVSSNESVSTMTFAYRVKPFLNGHIAPVIKVMNLSDQFTTDNTDENLLSTKISGLGFGGRLNADFVPPLWKPAKSKLGFALQQVFVDINYFPSVTATDSGITRGTTSNGSSGMLYRVGLTSLLYLEFVPLIKRFILQASYGVRSYNLKFQGPTISEVGNLYQIPPGGAAKMKETDFRIFFGIRISDPLSFSKKPPVADGFGDAK